jgi:Trk K+ transport system NAD-binding subunit
VIIPHGNTAIERGDVITAFGTGESRVQLSYVVQGQPMEQVEEDAT